MSAEDLIEIILPADGMFAGRDVLAAIAAMA
jgi:hypothetical protein